MSSSEGPARKILIVTGARSEYDIMFPVLKALESDKRFELGVVVTGAHLSEQFGRTIDLIERDGFPIVARIFNLVESSEKIGRAISFGRLVPALAQAFDTLNPDIVLVTGDREEALATAVTGGYMDIAVAHLFGGDVVKDGNIDDATRYATSKFAHLHLTAHPRHSEVLRLLGEDDWRIHYVGSPALDRFEEVPAMTRRELASALGIPPEGPFLLVTYHPSITEFDHEGEHAARLMQALIQTDLPCLVNSPNTDAGYRAIRDTFDAYGASTPRIVLFDNLPRELHVNVMRHTSCMVGNSSSGILEAPSFGLPVVNVGPRQRERVTAGNVEFVGYNREKIVAAVKRAVYDEEYRQKVACIDNPYGDGRTTPRIVDILGSIDISPALLHKCITY